MAPLILLLYNMAYGIICVSNFKKLKFLTEWNSIGIFNLPYVGRSLLWCIRFQRSVCCESAAPIKKQASPSNRVGIFCIRYNKEILVKMF